MDKLNVHGIGILRAVIQIKKRLELYTPRRIIDADRIINAYRLGETKRADKLFKTYSRNYLEFP